MSSLRFSPHLFRSVRPGVTLTAISPAPIGPLKASANFSPLSGASSRSIRYLPFLELDRKLTEEPDEAKTADLISILGEIISFIIWKPSGGGDVTIQNGILTSNPARVSAENVWRCRR